MREGNLRLQPRRAGRPRPWLQALWLRLCEQDWLRQVRAAHLPEVLQRSGNTKKQFFIFPRGAETI